MEHVDVNTSSGTQVPLIPGTNVAIELIKPCHPFFISPSDSPGMLLVSTTFDGKIFGRWKRSMLIALTVKNKSGFIDRSTQEPAAGANLHSAWSKANNMVISWLLNSPFREISENVIYSYTAKDLWTELEARFGQSSGAKLFQLQKDLSDVVQEQRKRTLRLSKMNDWFNFLWDLMTLIVHLEINVVTSYELFGDSIMTSTESEEHEKLLAQVQLAQVMQMLQKLKIKDQGNTSDVIASVNCSGPFKKSLMLLGEIQNGLYILKNRRPVVSCPANSCF